MLTDRRLADFLGAWRLDREIHHDGQPNAFYQGQAIWTATQQGAEYREAGHLTVSGHAPMRTERKYLWSEQLDVFFEDGRFFHSVPASGGETEHWCDPDMYQVRYIFADWPRFETIWHVQGPRKAYRMVSRYAPMTTRC